MEQILQELNRILKHIERKMKKFVITIVSVVCLCSCAQAQGSWWLFPGKKDKKENVQTKKNDTTTVRSATMEAARDSIILDKDELWLDGWSDDIRVALILPFKADQKPSSNYLEMYSGALLALRDLGSRGLKINLRVFDSASSNYHPDREALDAMDLIIGPVDFNGIAETSSLCSRSRMVVSPLEPKAASLVSNGNVIQSPVGWARQVDVMVDWLAMETGRNDQVIVIRDASIKGNGEQSAYLMSKLAGSGILYRNINSIKDLQNMKHTQYRILIASDDDAFITKEVREIGIAATIHNNITLYSTSRLRNCVGPDVFDLYTANTRMAATYYVDYDSEAVKKFVLEYRSIFQREPGSFAFQGYDIMNYYLSAYSTLGRKWFKRLPEFPGTGLQSDFNFKKNVGDGRENTAVRKVIYSPDLSISLL